MTKEQIKEEAINYIKSNLDIEMQLKTIVILLDDISNFLYENGNIKESNSITTCLLEIKEVLKNE